MARSRKVAVIGAGVSGLAAACELLRENHRVVVFEKSDRVGGTWVYDPDTDSDPAGLDPDRRVAHGSLYWSLRTNLPRPLMGFRDYPFPVGPAESFGDPRPFPSHEEVLKFLEKFARDTGVAELVRFGSEVVRVSPGRTKDEWLVESKGKGGKTEVEEFEAVVVCNGHHTEPRLAYIPGIGNWPGKQIHSHNYRNPEPFCDQVIVIIGRGASGHDVSRELSKVSKEVHLASRSPDIEIGKLDGYDNIWQHSTIKCAHEDGMVEFTDGSSLLADVILHCTGYKYCFPFLEPNQTVSIDNNRVGPLYKHVFPPHLAPGLSFVGLLNKVIVFMTIELQAKWVASVLSDRVKLPTEEDMIASIHEFYQQMEEDGIPIHLTHSLYPNEIEYLNWLLSEVGLPSVEEWRTKSYRSALKRISSNDDGYRDALDADCGIQQ